MTDEELELIRMRLANSGAGYGATEVATAARELGLVVSDALVLHAMEALRRTSTGAGPLEPLLHRPGVTDVLVNGPDQVFVDCGHGLELTDVRFANDDEVRRLAARLPRRSDAASTTPAHASMPVWPTAPGCTRSCPCSPTPARACRCACLPGARSASTSGSPTAR